MADMYMNRLVNVYLNQINQKLSKYDVEESSRYAKSAISLSIVAILLTVGGAIWQYRNTLSPERIIDEIKSNIIAPIKQSNKELIIAMTNNLIKIENGLSSEIDIVQTNMFFMRREIEKKQENLLNTLTNVTEKLSVIDESMRSISPMLQQQSTAFGIIQTNMRLMQEKIETLSHSDTPETQRNLP